jgi:potassium-dependent mechanosensitive channel
MRLQDPGFANTPIMSFAGSRITPLTLALAGVILAATIVVARLLHAGIPRALARRGVTERGTGLVAARLVQYVVMIIGLAIAFQTAGIQLGSLFTAGAVFAVGLGFAMQNIVQNFVSGVILLVERSIKPDDILEIDGAIVRVIQLRIRTTLVRTLNDEDLIVPNSTLVQGTVKNYTLSDLLYRLRVVVGVSYGSDMEAVRRVLEEVAAATTWREQERDPKVLLLDFGTSSVDWEVSVWTRDPWRHRVLSSELREAIWFAFRRAQITIAFPQLDVHLDPAVVEALGLGGAGRALRAGTLAPPGRDAPRRTDLPEDPSDLRR